MKKRIISLLLCLCMVFSLLPTAVLAADGKNPDTSAGSEQVTQQDSENLGDQADPDNQADPDDLDDSEDSDDSDAPQLLGEGLGSALSGNCGATTEDTVSWALTKNEDGRTYTLTISGGGAMADYYAQYVQRKDEFTGDIAPWRRALLSDPSVERTTEDVVPITEVKIGDGVTRIGSGAFAYTELTGTVTFNENVTSYGDGVFARDTSITAVDWTNFKPTEKIRDGWATVYEKEHIAVPYAFFDGCSSLDTSIIGGTEYHGQLVLPDTIEAIYVAAFRGTGFSTVDFSDGLSSIQAVGSYAITKLANMTEFTYPGNVDFYGVNDEGQNNVIQGGGIEKLTIAKDVTELPANFCTNTEKLTAIEFESGSQLTKIGEMAFYGTQALKSIDIPSTVTSIGESAFADCFSLEKIELGQIASLGQNTFARCSSLETAKIQGSPSVIYPSNMFGTWGSGHSAAPLKTLEIGAGEIQFDLSRQKDSIETIVLGDGVTAVPARFAVGCTKLTSVSLPDALTSVPAYAFNGCSSLAEVGISENSKLQSIGNGAFANSALTQIYIPKNVTSIGEGAFNRTPITVFDMSDVLADNMTVGLYAINNWYSKDEQANWPAWKDNFKYIYVSNSGAAKDVKAKTSNCNYAFFVTNGGSVDATKTGFAAVYREGYTAQWFETENFTGSPVTGTPATGKTYYVQWTDGEINGFCGAAGNEKKVRWVLADEGDGGYTLSITGTGAMADYTCNITGSKATQPWRESMTGVAPTAITKVVVGNGVTNIGKFACDGLSQVKEYNIAASVEDIGAWGVCGQNAETYTLNGSTHYVTDDGVLMSADRKTLVSYPGGKDAVDEYVIPNTVETILAGAFVGSDAKKVVIPSSVTNFPRFSFGGSTVEEIEFNATVETLEGGAFSGLSKLKSLVFGGTTLTTIEGQACSDLSSLTEITFPDSLKTIGDQAFKVLPDDGAAAPNLKKVTFGKGMSTIGSVVFLRQSALEVIDMTHCAKPTLKAVGEFNSRGFDGSGETPYKNTPIVYTADADVAGLVKQNNRNLIYAVTNGGTFPADTVFETGKLAEPKKEGCLFLGWYADPACNGEKVTTFAAGKTYYAKWMDHIPEPTEADFANGLVTVKCLSPVPHTDVQYGLNAAVAADKYVTERVNATEYSVTYDADAFAVNGHSLYSADTLNWKLTYDGSKWNLAPQTSGVDDVVLVTHAPTTLDEVTKFIDGRTDVIKTSCVNGETATCAYGLMVAFVNKDHVVSVEQEKDSSGEPIRGSYIATLKVDQFAEACAKACNNKSFASSPRTHDVLSQNPVQWRFKVTQAEVSTDAGAEKQYVWSAEPVEAGKDDVCQVAHRVVLTFSYNQHDVTVDDTKVEYKYNTTAITNNVEVPTPTREGYTFIRWLDADGNAFDPTANVTEDHTYDNIEWKPIKYRVIFNANAGGKTVTGTMEDQVFTYDVEAKLNANTFACTDEKNGVQLYVFGGWNTAADGSGTAYTDEQEVSNLTAESEGEITLYAQWQHVTKKLTYVSAQGDAPDAADVDIFSEVVVANAPAGFDETKYIFKGWRSNVAVGYEVMQPGDKFVMPNTDVTLTAVWEEIVPAVKHNVTYQYGIKTTVTTAPVEYGVGSIVNVMQNDPSETGYTFTGWRSSHEGRIYQRGDTFVMPDTDVILTAQWQKNPTEYTVMFMDGDRTVGSQKGVAGSLVLLKDALSKEGYTFVGWKSNVDGKVYEASTRYTMPELNVKMSAVWQANPAKYTVTYDLNGAEGTAPAAAQYVADAFVTVTEETFTKEGFIFAGWRSSFGGTVYQANDTFQMPGINVTLTAQWQPEEATYTVSTSVDGAVTPVADGLKANALYKIEAADPTKDGYVFNGWLLSSTGTIVHSGDTFNMPAGDVVLTAQWEQIVPVAKYTVTYQIDSMQSEAGTYEVGSTVRVMRDSPTKSGYTFLYWRSSHEGKLLQRGDTFEMPNTNVTLTAQWQKDPTEYKVQFLVDGRLIGQETGIAGSFITLKPAQTKTGFTFVGWQSSVGEGKIYPANSRFEIPATTVKMTAVWQADPATYTVTYALNGGEGAASDSNAYVEGAFVTVTDAAVTKDGFVFAGWRADVGGDVYQAGDKFQMPASNVVLTAQWQLEEATYTVSTSVDGAVTPVADGLKANALYKIEAADPTKDGYVFTGWLLSSTGTIVHNGDTFNMPAGNVVLTAQWEKEAESYTVTYKNGEASESAGSYKAGEWVNVKEAPAAAAGQTFKGWESNVGGTVYQPGKTFEMPDTNVVLTAIWDSETYKITWKNGDATLSETTVKHGETPKYIGETPTKEATAEYTYTFSGWTPEPAAATADATYEATFTETKRSYTVKFYNADGTLLESKQVEYGTVPKLGRTPTLEGNSQYSYTFKTWSPKLAPVTGDAEYTAVYDRTENTYTVTWVIEGVSTTETYTYNEMPAYKGDTPAKADTSDAVYEFTGWSPALSLVTRDVTYTAQFRTIGKYTVSYDLAGGESAKPDDAKYAVGSVVTAAGVPTRNGYVFEGWLVSYERKTVNANGTFTMPATDVTLTAQWTPAVQVGGAYIVAADPKHAVHEAAYSDKLTARKADATGAEITNGVKFILVDDEGHALGTTDLGHGLTLSADGTITGTAMGAGTLTFNVRLANLDNEFVSEIRTITLVIEKAPRTCSVSIANWTYGDEPNEPVVTLSKPEGTETITFYYKVKGADDSTYTKEVPVNAGHYTVKAVVGESANYLGCEATVDFEIYKKEIKSVSLSVTAPVACAAAQTTIADGDGFTGTITWTPAPVDGKFDYATEYTATVVLTPDSNHFFTANTTAEGWRVSYDEASGKLTLTHKFEKTELGKIETPVIRPNGGRFTGRQTVKITCATEGAVIHYTTDGTTPTASSPVYEGAFTITETTTVKAIAVKDKYLDSEVASATFTKYTPRPSTGGSTVIPTPSKTELKFNTADHFAYVNGYPNGTVKPTGNVTRAEVAAILYRIMDADCSKAYYDTTSSYRDVAHSDWYNVYVATLENAGVIVDTKAGGYFRPNEAITRAELAAMLAQFADTKSAPNYFTDVTANYWAANAIAVCAKLGWINGYPDGTFRPDQTVTRAEMMAMINRALERTPKSAADLLTGMKVWSDNANVNAWYYLDVQEATNSHTYTKSGTHETWKKLR